MKKFHIETYGCQMNVYDSEIVASILQNAGYRPAEDIDSADIIIFNTCSVREHAEVRVLGRISNEVSRKMLAPGLKIGVIGCMAQRMGKRLLEQNNDIDFVVGVDEYRRLPHILHEISGNGISRALHRLDASELYDDFYPVRKGNFNAFVTIMRGCNNFCSYCIVPYVRGQERSRPVDSILKEVEKAGNEGYKDITLLGQNVNSYSYKDIDFPNLLNLVNQLSAIVRIRFVTSHPKDLSDKLIRTMAECSKVCEHLHLPMQSGDNEILARMNRRYTFENYYEIIKRLREAMPGIALTTDIMTGFPGETVQHFQNTFSAMKKIEFDFAFMFKYSVREGTLAEKFADDVDEKEKLERLDTIIKLQSEITLAKYRSQIDRTVEVYAEKVSKKTDRELSGKTRDFKIVVFSASKDLIGSFVKVKIVDATGWTLKGQIV